MTRYAVVDPTTNRLVQEYPTATDAQVDDAVAAASAAFTGWRRLPVTERAALMASAGRLYRANRERLAQTVTLEMGKPKAEALWEVDLVADIFDYYAAHGPRLAAERELPVASGRAVVRSEPLGVLLGIMPWNYPHYQVARFVAPNLVLGNTIVLKHAPGCPRSAELVAQLLAEAGVPDGVYVNLYATNEQVRRIIEDPAVQGVSLTGSDRAGRAVGEIAGRAGKKYVLELGGSDPFVVLPDADVDAAAAGAVAGRWHNSGQACTSSKRIIVHTNVYDDFLEAFLPRVRALRLGDPDGDVDLGPLASEAAAARIAEQTAGALAHGATALVAGGRLDGAGAFVAPTVLAGVTPDAPAYHEEIFGPVAVVHRAASVDDAVRLANDTRYGLGAVVYGTDEATVADVVDRLDVGMVSVNAPSMTQPDLPFGGVKASGVGRELGEYGMAEFVNRKLVRYA